LCYFEFFCERSYYKYNGQILKEEETIENEPFDQGATDEDSIENDQQEETNIGNAPSDADDDEEDAFLAEDDIDRRGNGRRKKTQAYPRKILANLLIVLIRADLSCKLSVLREELKKYLRFKPTNMFVSLVMRVALHKIYGEF